MAKFPSADCPEQRDGGGGHNLTNSMRKRQISSELFGTVHPIIVFGPLGEFGLSVLSLPQVKWVTQTTPVLHVRQTVQTTFAFPS